MVKHMFFIYIFIFIKILSSNEIYSYNIFTDLTITAYRWQSRRKLEKIAELDIRHKRIKENLYAINPFLNTESARDIFPWIESSEKNFKENWEYRGLDLEGFFDYKNKILITTTKNNEPGYNVVIPFYCYSEAGTNRLFPILVDRGWFPDFWKDKFDTIANKSNFTKDDLNNIRNERGSLEHIKGVLYKGDQLNQFSKENDLVNKKLFTQRPEELAKALSLENYEICSKFIVKEIKSDKKIYPEKVTVNDLMFTLITPAKHQEYAYFWLFVSLLNFGTNIYIWLF